VTDFESPIDFDCGLAHCLVRSSRRKNGIDSEIATVGDDVIVLLKMEGGRFTELGGFIQEISPAHAYFALDSVHLITAKDFDSPLESKKWPKTATKLLRVASHSMS
jgi:hypothetical protein